MSEHKPEKNFNPKSNPKGSQENERKATLASVIFMCFGLVLVVGSFAVVHDKKNQMNMSSTSPSSQNFSKMDVTNTIDYKRKMTGLQINNERVTAEVNKDQELLNLGNKSLNKVQPDDVVGKDVVLDGEPNNLANLHDRGTAERESYPDVDISRELGSDRENYNRAEEMRERDTRTLFRNLVQRAEDQHVKLSYDPKTDEFTAERMPQSVNQTPVEDSTPAHNGGGISK